MIELTLLSILLIFTPVIYILKNYRGRQEDFLTNEPLEKIMFMRHLIISGISLFFISMALYYI